MEYLCVIVFEISTKFDVVVSLMHQRSPPPKLESHMDRFGVISAGETGESGREFPRARPACRGTPETPTDNISCSLRARTEVVIIYRRGCSVRARTELCARKEDFGLGENRTVCSEDGYSLDDIISD